jgi:hypothetical protein
MTRRIWQTCASQIFDWHDVFDGAFFAGEQGYLSAGMVLLWLGKWTTLMGEIIHLTWGNGVPGRGKWGI